MSAATLTLDFRGAPLFGWRIVGYGVLAVAIAVSIGLAGLKVKSDAVLARARAAQQEALRLGSAPPAARASDSQRDRGVAQANAALDALYLPWDDLFAMVEGAGSRGLGLLSISPDPVTQNLRIAGRAKTLDEVLSYVERLSGQPLLSEVHLISFSTVQRDGASGIEFMIGARWTRS